MKRVGVSIVLVLVTFLASAQNWERIREDDRYIWGEGWGRTVEEADRDALASLTSKISIAVSSRYRELEEQRNTSSGVDYISIRSNQLAMTSNTTLSNTNQVVRKTGRRYYVGRWINRNELNTVFSDRKDRVLEFEKSAQEAEEDGRIDDALRYHYWAFVLLRSVQRPAELRDERGKMLLNSIPERMNAIFDDLEPRATKRGSALVLSFRFRGLPVRGLDFTYFDGARWSSQCSAPGGSAQVELAPGALADVVQVKIIYTYCGDALMDNELADILASAELKPLKKSLKIFRRSI